MNDVLSSEDQVEIQGKSSKLDGVQLRTLGTCELVFTTNGVDARPVELNSRKARAVLAFLAANYRAPQPREKLATMLWPDTDLRFSRTNLRQTLALVRKSFGVAALGDDALISSGSDIGLNPEIVRTDVNDYHSALKSNAVSDLAAAASLYRGPFLDGLVLGEDTFDEWVEAERRYYKETQTRLLLKLLDSYRQASEHERAIQTANELLRLDPCQEHAYRQLMLSYAAQGRHHSAIREYETCCRMLRRDLNVAPDDNTREVYRQIRQGLITTASSTAVTKNGPEQSAPAGSSNSDSTDDFKSRDRGRSARIPAFLFMATALVAGVFLWQAYADREGVSLSKNSTQSDNRDRPDTAVLNTLVPEYATDAEQTSASSISEQIENPSERLPALAVLPFTDLGANNEQAYFSAGLTEDLITALAGISGIRVISSSYSFANPQVSVESIAEAGRHGVTHMLLGSVQRTDDRLRVNAKLLDITSQEYVWAKQYDKQWADVFELQDDLTRKVVGSLSVTLSTGDLQRLKKLTQVDPESHDRLLRGLHPFRQFTPEGNLEARRYFEQAILLDDQNARAHANIALSYAREVVFRYPETSADPIQRGLQETAIAESINPALPQIQFTKAVLYLAAGQFDDAIAASYKAIALEAGYADGYAVLSQTLAYAGQPEQAESAAVKARELNPIDPFSYIWLHAHALFLQERFIEALPLAERTVQKNSSFQNGQLLLMAIYVRLGRWDDAQWQVSELLTRNPGFDLVDERQRSLYRESSHQELFFSSFDAIDFAQ